MKPKALPLLAAVIPLLLSGMTVRAAEPAEPKPNPDAAKADAAKEEMAKAEARLLEVGKTAPDFTLPLSGGGEVGLANLLKFGKAVLVAFWEIKPENGGADMAKLQKLHAELESKGLQTVAINPADEGPEVARFVQEAKVQFQVAIDGKETNRAVTNVFRARVRPTYYLLDPDGKVLWRSIGLKEAPLREALAKAGVK